MINFYDSAYDKAMTQSLADPNSKKAATTVLKVFHETVRAHIMHSYLYMIYVYPPSDTLRSILIRELGH